MKCLHFEMGVHCAWQTKKFAQHENGIFVFLYMREVSGYIFCVQCFVLCLHGSKFTDDGV